MTNDNGGSLANVFQTTDCSKLRNMLRNYFNYARVDTVGADAEDRTWPATYYAYNETDIMGGPTSGPGSVCGWFLLANGTALKIWNPNPCTTSSSSCFSIMVDVNGPTKRPNAMGKDIYALYVYSNGLVRPDGWSYTATYMATGWMGCNDGAGGGWGCSAKFLMSDN